MMVLNVHERVLHAPVAIVGGMIDRLGASNNALWPGERWPPMRFRGPLAVGTSGGHGPIRYTVEAYEPGRSVRFRFTAPRGFIGVHGFEVEEIAAGSVRLRHVLEMRLEGWARLSWPLAFRWLHDALLEDALERAEAFSAARPVRQRRWSLWVRVLRLMARAASAPRRKHRRAKAVLNVKSDGR
jgi:hypothetical protein